MTAAPTCRANRHPVPSGDLPPVEWLKATFQQMRDYEPCGRPATHLARGDRKPLCDAHAAQLREALRDPQTFGNILAGGRARTEQEIAAMVRPMQDPQS